MTPAMTPGRLRTGPALVLLGLLAACKTTPPVRPDARLLLDIDAPEPVVSINGRTVAMPPGPGPTEFKLPAGPQRIEVRAPGYFTAYEEVTLSSRESRRLRLHLRPDPDADTAPPALPADEGLPRPLPPNPPVR